jgi:hypothetical protein
MDSIILQREEIKVYLFSLALPMTEWSWQRAFELSTFVLYLYNEFLLAGQSDIPD